MVCGLKQCSGSKIIRKQHEMKLIFKLDTLRPNELNIDFSFFVIVDLARITHTRAKTMVFLFVYRVLHARANHACLRVQFLYGVAHGNHSTF